MVGAAGAKRSSQVLERGFLEQGVPLQDSELGSEQGLRSTVTVHRRSGVAELLSGEVATRL